MADLQAAVEADRFELAASLRDRLRSLETEQSRQVALKRAIAAEGWAEGSCLSALLLCPIRTVKCLRANGPQDDARGADGPGHPRTATRSRRQLARLAVVQGRVLVRAGFLALLEWETPSGEWHEVEHQLQVPQGRLVRFAHAVLVGGGGRHTPCGPAAVRSGARVRPFMLSKSCASLSRPAWELSADRSYYTVEDEIRFGCDAIAAAIRPFPRRSSCARER